MKHRATQDTTFHGITNLTSHGFQVRSEVRNNGICGPWGVPKDAKGGVNVSASWTDVCLKQQDNTAPTVSGQLIWNQETVLTLPPETTRFIVRATLADGSVRVISGSGRFDWFVAEYNEANKVLIIRPRKIEDAPR